MKKEILFMDQIDAKLIMLLQQNARVSFCLYRYMIAKTPGKGKGYRLPAFISP